MQPIASPQKGQNNWEKLLKCPKIYSMNRKNREVTDCHEVFYWSGEKNFSTVTDLVKKKKEKTILLDSAIKFSGHFL